jgi:hypothetical protein
MSPTLSMRLLVAISASMLVATSAGCASKEERAARRKWETQDERATREVFQSDWLIPSVSNEDKDFFYKSWLRSSDL